MEYEVVGIKILRLINEKQPINLRQLFNDEEAQSIILDSWDLFSDHLSEYDQKEKPVEAIERMVVIVATQLLHWHYLDMTVSRTLIPTESGLKLLD